MLLSGYTQFSYGITSAPSNSVTVSLDPVRKMLAQTKDNGRIFPAHELLVTPLVNYEVNVTNTGTVDSDEIVLGFLSPPGAGTGGVPLQQLYGFERVHVPAGESVLVSLYPELTHFTHVDTTGERYELPGEYTFQFGVSGQDGLEGMGYAEHKIMMA